MAVVGTLGDIVFSVSRNKVNTFNNMKWESSARFSTHNRLLKASLVEFTGLDADKISFSMYFSVFLGVDPAKEIIKLLTAERQGKVMPLIIGGRKYSKNNWVVTKTTKELERFDGKGRLLVAKVNVQLLGYAER